MYDEKTAFFSTCCRRVGLKRFGVLLVFPLLVVLTMPAAPEMREALIYRREAIGEGAWWRLLTAHWVHLSASHALMNLTAWGLIWGYGFEAMNTARWLSATVVSALGTALGIFFFDAEVAAYVGLSGLLHGVLVTVAMVRLRDACRSGGWVLAVVAVKLVWEQWQGPLAGTAALAGGPVLVDAHLFGMASGVVAGLLLKFRFTVHG